MKTFIVILGTIVLITFASAATGEVVIKQEPLKYQDVATTKGEILFANNCAVCHGTRGKGNGPAASALSKPVADLTVFSANNDGVFPDEFIKKAIAEKTRDNTEGTIGMLDWEDELLALRPDWHTFRQEAFAKSRIRYLTKHIETLQHE